MRELHQLSAAALLSDNAADLVHNAGASQSPTRKGNKATTQVDTVARERSTPQELPSSLQNHELMAGSSVVPPDVVVARNQFLIGENARLRALLQSATDKIVKVLHDAEGNQLGLVK